MTEKIVRARAKVQGRVQGVWFRRSTADFARGRGVAGWVRNLPDGSVEAVVEGSSTAVDAVLDYVRVGPPRAEVTAVAVVWEAPVGETGFEIRD